MYGLRFKADYSVTSIKPETKGIYEVGTSGAWKTWYVSPHASTKGGGNKGRIYTIIYAPGAYRNTKAEG